ncbi:T9SS type A sorting domain-containing protein [Flavobacterium nackdongense]|uniref:T9SS type A sorting domain-containing protein n=1 Tax=Flavobacterium nackdongense TaxID=2547394 RepID=A0A4P6YBG8_9FLAO|nr:T9SS type A sorting domain-containing protein [Flavobacterium nackdongense]QBN18114.1 T9SS type A sorting domain-containing protein [Flavobacterium nackdongense]
MKTKVISFAIFAVVLFVTANLSAQTAGTMTFNFTTVQQGTKTKQVNAVWIENASGTFIKTNLLYIGDSTSDHLPQFSLKSGANGTATNGNGAVQDASTGNTINAITGATRTSSTAPLAWGPYSVSWDGKTGAATPVLVTDGSYKVWVEMAWNDNPDLHDFINTGYSFTKGASITTTNPSNIGPLTSITLTWTPSALSLDSVYKTKIAIYPNPSNGIINVQYNDIPVSKIDVVNVLGQVVKSIKLDASSSETTESIDLSGNANGLYIINVSTNETSSSYKVLLDK